MKLTFHIKKRIKPFLSFLLAAVLLVPALEVSAAAPDYAAEAEERKSLPIDTNEIENWPQGPEIGADAAILMDSDTGTILYGKNIENAEYPASITKLMTALLAVQSCTMSEIVTFSNDAVFSVPTDGSNIGMDAGQELTMEQALYGVLVGSANEAANAVAEHVSGSVAAFTELMNAKAAELGCINTHFANANGLFDENHYTCAYDMALIAKAFFSYELLDKMSNTYYYYIAPTEKQPDEIPVYSHNQLLEGRPYAYEYLVGSKTGYTDLARQTLVSCAEKDGMRLICVILKEESPAQFTDTTTLFDYGFRNFQLMNVSQNETTYSIDNSDFFETNTDIFGSSQAILQLNTNDKVILPVTAHFSDLDCVLSYDTQEASSVATLSYAYHGQPVGTASIDIVGAREQSFEFDETTAEETDPSAAIDLQETEADADEHVIFINIKIIIFLVLGGAIGLAVLLYAVSYIRSYHFSTRRRDKRRRRRRSRPIKKKRVTAGRSLRFNKQHHFKKRR